MKKACAELGQEGTQEEAAPRLPEVQLRVKTPSKAAFRVAYCCWHDDPCVMREAGLATTLYEPTLNPAWSEVRQESKQRDSMLTDPD